LGGSVRREQKTESSRREHGAETEHDEANEGGYETGGSHDRGSFPRAMRWQARGQAAETLISKKGACFGGNPSDAGRCLTIELDGTEQGAPIGADLHAKVRIGPSA